MRINLRRPYRVRRADPVPLYDALQDLLERYIELADLMPATWWETVEGRRARGTMLQSIEAMARAAGVPNEWLDESFPSLH